MTTQLQIRKENTSTFKQMLEKSIPQIQKAIPKHLTAERIARIAETAFKRDSKLADCSPISVISAIMVASQLGLEIGQLGQCYLIPYNSPDGPIATLIPGWQGMVDLVARRGQATVWTDVIRQGESWVHHRGSSPSIEVQGDVDSEAEMLYAYAVGRIKGSDWPIIERWSMERIAKHRDRYNKVGKRHYSYKGLNEWEMYARKVVLLQVLKYLPKSVEIITASELEYSAQQGTQNLDLKAVEDVYEGVFAVDEAKEPETGDTQE